MKLKRIIASFACMGLFVSLFSAFNPIAADAAVKSIKLSNKKLSMTVGEKKVLKVKYKPAKSKAKIVWSSSKKKVAKVSKKGKVTAKSEGSAVITAKIKASKIKAACKVKVRNAVDVTPTNVSVPSPTPTTPAATLAPTNVVDNKVYPTEIKFEDEDYVTVEIGESYTLNSQVAPANTDKEAMEYKSERDWVASVDKEGKVTALYPGMTIITLTSKKDSNVNARIHVNVVDTSIPDDSFNQYNSDIGHGKINAITYASDYRDTGKAQARVWTPYDYSENEKYNILYCLHGGGGDMWYWTNDKGGANDGCAADKILDNMYAEGLLESCIVVFPNGTVPYDNTKTYPNVPDDAVITDWGKDCFLLEYEIIYNLMPYMNEHYSIAQGKEHTAICGLSMGCGQTLDIGLKNPEIFGYVGAFSGSPFARDDQKLVTCEEDADRLNSNIKLFTIMVGSEDGLANDKTSSSSKAFGKVCTEFEVNYMFIEEQGLAHEDACWDRNLYKFMKYAFK